MTEWHCLTDIELEGLYRGRAGPEDLRHLFACPACRNRMVLVEEALADETVFVFEQESLALAAKGAQTIPVRSLCTHDESLICRLERESGRDDLTVTVLADKAQWGEVVMIWPGAGEPFAAVLGEKMHTSTGTLGAINLWLVSAAEALWKGRLTELPESISGANNSLVIESMSTGVRLSYVGTVLSITLLREEGRWKTLAFPALLSMQSEFSIALFTPLSALPLQ
jgi:uncharacterized protein YbaR (Trm112 family)